MNRLYVGAALSGLLFGVGLAVSGMSNPDIVLGFLDVTGDFNPTLLFVLGGAVGVAGIAFRFVLPRRRPVFDTRFHLPTAGEADRRLVGGAILFGIGWGLVGYCPGPALVALGSGVPGAVVFVPAMLLGMWLERLVSARTARAVRA